MKSKTAFDIPPRWVESGVQMAYKLSACSAARLRRGSGPAGGAACRTSRYSERTFSLLPWLLNRTSRSVHAGGAATAPYGCRIRAQNGLQTARRGRVRSAPVCTPCATAASPRSVLSDASD
ncbi:jg17000 [Pararge aegeria aegeria]|uniref:Jg17000 protein n=1 Tax=Pararge aegeria aegeria TaxID=348720 RepID=A0A8S4R589_9NEOP|nr:jg17000 [Pararge aegeria aegeria]